MGTKMVTNMTLTDNPMNRKKLGSMSKLEVMADDPEQSNQEFWEKLEDFLQQGTKYKITIEEYEPCDDFDLVEMPDLPGLAKVTMGRRTTDPTKEEVVLHGHVDPGPGYVDPSTYPPPTREELRKWAEEMEMPEDPELRRALLERNDKSE